MPLPNITPASQPRRYADDLGELVALSFVKPDELAALRRVHLWTVYKWLSATPHRLPPAVRVGRQVMFRRADVEAWLRTLGTVGDTTAPPAQPRRGRPTKVEAARRRAAQQGAGGAA